MASMRKYAGSSFIGLDDVKARPLQGTIVKVSEGDYGRPVLLLDTGQRFTVNATNVKTLIAAFGEDDADWTGMKIELFSGLAKYQGKEQDSVAVKALSPGKPLAEGPPRARSGTMMIWTTKFRFEPWPGVSVATRSRLSFVARDYHGKPPAHCHPFCARSVARSTALGGVEMDNRQDRQADQAAVPGSGAR